MHSPDYQYYDIMVSNLNNTLATLPPPLSFVETRSIPILKNPRDYAMSITRFSLSTQCLPVFLPTIAPNSTDINETVYKITLAYAWTSEGGVQSEFIYTETVSFRPQNLSAATPSSPSNTSDGLQDNSTGYYNIYSYEYFVGIVNYYLAKCYSDLLASLPAEVLATVPTSAINQPPILIFDTSTNLATLYIPATLGSTGGNLWGVYNKTVDTAPANNQFRLYMNTGLYSLFSSFPALNTLGYTYSTLGVSTTSTSMTNQIIIPYVDSLYPTINMPIGAAAANQYACYPVVQEYSTVNSWSPVSSIVFTSNFLPVVNNQLSNPVVYVNNQLVSLTQASSNFATVITDFCSANFKTDDVVLYNPTAEYRRIQLIGDRPINTVDVNVFWLDKASQKLLPFYLLAGGSFSMKILFEKILKD